MIPWKHCSIWLTLLAIVTLITLVFGFLLLEGQKPEDGYGALLRILSASVVPSLIATILAALFAVVFSNHLHKHQTQQTRARNLETGAIPLAGPWKLRDWRHDYNEKYEKDHAKPRTPEEVIKWYEAREAHCQKEEREDRDWKHSEDVRIDQTGDYIEVYFSHLDSEKRRRVRYRIEGRIVGKILIGEWREISPNNDVYWFGAVQLLVDEGDRDYGKTMLGRWTGTHSNGGEIRCGIWEFVETARGRQQAAWPTGIVDNGATLPDGARA